MSQVRRPSFSAVSAGFRIDEWTEPGGQAVVRVTGDVDEVTGPDLLSTLSRAIFRESRVCCDLSAVGHFGATGADVLAVAHLTAAMSRGSLTVRGVRGGAAQTLETTGLDRILTVVP